MISDQKTIIDELVTEAKRALVRGNRDRELDVWKQIDVENKDRDPNLLWQLGSVLIAHEEYDRAEAIIAELGELDLTGAAYRYLTVEYLASRQRTKELVDALRDWSEGEFRPRELIPIVETAWTYTGAPEVFDVLKRLCKKGVPDFTAVSTGAIFHVLDPVKVLPKINHFTANKQQLRLLGGFVEALIDHGRPQDARSVITSVLETFTGNETVKSKVLSVFSALNRLCDAWVKPSDLPRPVIEEDFSRDVIVSEPGLPGKLAVVFTGWNGRPLVGSRILDNQLAKLGYQTVFLRDANSVGYGCGVRSLGDNRQQTLQSLEGLISECGGTDPVFIGASIGTFGAVSHGLPLGVRRFVLFGPVTAAGDRPFLHDLGDFRGGVLLNRTSRNVPPGEQLMSDFMSGASHSFAMKVIVGERHKMDVNYATSIASFDGVETVKLSNYAEHNTLRPVIAEGRFEEIVEA